MRKNLLFLLFLFVAGFTMGQKIKAYEYWVDDNFAGKVNTSITPVKYFHLQADLPMSSVTTGFHALYIRFIDSTNSWSIPLTQYFMKYPAGYAITKQIVAYEYWADDDYAGKIYQPVSPASVYHFTENLNLSSVSNGFHFLNLRFKDNTGAWSGVLTQYFIKYPAGYATTKQIVACEYWVDENYAGKTYLPVSPASVYHLTENLNLVSVSNGFHLLYMRFKDNTGAWSSVCVQYFTKFGQPVILPNKVVTYRFWFDDDLGSMETYSFPQPVQFVHWADTIEMPFLPVGQHIMNYQFRDTNQIFSSIKTDTFNVTSCLPYSGRVISGPASVCVGQTGVVYAIRRIRNATGYVWSVPPGATIVGGDGTTSITVNYSYPAVSGNVTMYATNICGNSPVSIKAVTVHQLPHPTLAGEDTVCSGTSGWVYTTESGKSNYTWSISSGGTISTGGTAASPAATVTWNSTGTQWIRVNYTNEFGCRDTTDTQFDVLVKQSPMPTISGLNSLCAGTSGVVYTTQPGMTNYTWSISAGGTVTGGGTSVNNTITVTWNTAGAQWVKVNYTNSVGCQALVPTQYNITVHPLPVPTISGSASVCATSTGNVYTTQPEMTGYLWSVSLDGIITAGTGTNAITVTWNAVGTQTVSVNYTNANNCTAVSPTVYHVTVNPLPVPTISGPVSVCQTSAGNVYSTQPGMTGYGWTVSAGGAITAGSGTKDITVTWNTAGAKTVSVNYINAYGCTAAIATVYNVTVNPLPVASGSITGPVQVIQGQAGVGYSLIPIADASGYFWSLPTGATIVSGANTNSVIVDFSAIAVSGDISVHGTNACGNGSESQVLNVRVIPSSLSIENVSIENMEANCYSAAQTIIVAGNGTSFEVKTGGSATLIAGQNIIFRPTAKVALGGSMHGYITSNNEYCGTQKTPMVAVVAGEQEPIFTIASASFKVYPNPTTGSFTLEFVDKTSTGKVEVLVSNMHGEKLLTQEISGERSHVFSLSGRPPGVYLIHVLTGTTSETVKIIKQ